MRLITNEIEAKTIGWQGSKAAEKVDTGAALRRLIVWVKVIEAKEALHTAHKFERKELLEEALRYRAKCARYLKQAREFKKAG